MQTANYNYTKLLLCSNFHFLQLSSMVLSIITSRLCSHFRYIFNNKLFPSTSNELLSLEMAVCVWTEWKNALHELQRALRGDLATLQSLKERGASVEDKSEVAAQIRQLAASLIDKKKVRKLLVIKQLYINRLIIVYFSIKRMMLVEQASILITGVKWKS